MAPKAEEYTPSKGRARPSPIYELAVPDLKPLGSYVMISTLYLCSEFI